MWVVSSIPSPNSGALDDLGPYPIVTSSSLSLRFELKDDNGVVAKSRQGQRCLEINFVRYKNRIDPDLQ
jgi:hypothetical protein